MSTFVSRPIIIHIIVCYLRYMKKNIQILIPICHCHLILRSSSLIQKIKIMKAAKHNF